MVTAANGERNGTKPGGPFAKHPEEAQRPRDISPLVKAMATAMAQTDGSTDKAQSRAGMVATDIQSTAASRPILGR